MGVVKNAVLAEAGVWKNSRYSRRMTDTEYERELEFYYHRVTRWLPIDPKLIENKVKFRQELVRALGAEAAAGKRADVLFALRKVVRPITKIKVGKRRNSLYVLSPETGKYEFKKYISKRHGDEVEIVRVRLFGKHLTYMARSARTKVWLSKIEMR